MDQKKFNKVLQAHGSSLLDTIIGNFSNSDSDDDTDEQLLYEFIKEKHSHAYKKGTNSKKQNQTEKQNQSEEPNEDKLIPLPMEIYGRRTSKEKRRNLFYRSLVRRDILYLEVIEDMFRDSYELRVLAKEGDLMKLDDLDLVLYLPKLPEECKLIPGYLCIGHLIRAALCSCSINERKLFVTFDPKLFPKENPPVKLGRIEKEDLPFYIGCKRIGLTYSGYVQRSKNFIFGIWKPEFYKHTGFDPNRTYSFLNEWDGKTYPESELPDGGLEKMQYAEDSNKKMKKAIHLYNSGNVYRALQLINRALNLNPDSIKARLCRGTLYANIGRFKKAFIDAEDALKIEPHNEYSRRQMSVILIAAAKMHLDQENFAKYHQCVFISSKLDTSSEDAINLLRFYEVVPNYPSQSRERYVLTTTPQGSTIVYLPRPEGLYPELRPLTEADEIALRNRISRHRMRIQRREQERRRRRHRHRRRHSRSRSRSPIHNNGIRSHHSHRSSNRNHGHRSGSHRSSGHRSGSHRSSSHRSGSRRSGSHRSRGHRSSNHHGHGHRSSSHRSHGHRNHNHNRKQNGNRKHDDTRYRNQNDNRNQKDNRNQSDSHNPIPRGRHRDFRNIITLHQPS